MVSRIDIPTPYIFTIDTPLILFNGRLLQPHDGTVSDDNYLEFSPFRYGLKEIISPKELETLYFIHNMQRFEEYQTRYIQENIRRELRATANMRQEVIDNKVLSFIVNDLLPLITAEKLESDVEEILLQDREDKDNRYQRIDGRPSAQASATTSNIPVNRRANTRGGRQTRGTQNRDVCSNMDLPREVITEARRLKNEFMKKLDKDYEEYDRNHNAGRRRNNIDDRVSAILRNQNSAAARAPRYTHLDDGSILNESLVSENMMLVGEKVYDVVSVKEFLSYFREYMKPSVYRLLTSFESSTDPTEINSVVKQNIFDIDKKCRSRIRNKLRSSRIRIDGAYYIPFLKENSLRFRDDMIKDYSKLIEKQIKIEAFDKYEHQTRELYELAQEKKELHDIARRNNYEHNGAGFEVVNGQYFVYVTTSPYALMSPHTSQNARYVAFSPAKIGVSVRYNGFSIEFGNPVIMHRYRHPFLGDAQAYHTICLGDRGVNVSNDFRKLKPEQTALALLDQGKKTLMMGYRTGNNPYLPLRSDYDWRFITKDEVMKKGLVCLNEGMVGDKNGR